MKEIKHVNIIGVEQKYRHEHPDYEYYRRSFLPTGEAAQCTVAVYELPPGKAGFPYHYHIKNEEVFYILSGTGKLKTPQGERAVQAGDMLYFPANENGAHKLTNVSETENLIYIDFDTHNDLEVAVYPDSGKIGVWGKNLNQLYRLADQVEYYEGE